MAQGPYVLVVDDDPGIRRLLRRVLTAESYQVDQCTPGPETLQSITQRRFDLLVVDVDSPSCKGSDVIRELRRLSPVPILALSADLKEEVAVEVLESGADDYVQKPFRVRELLARVKNALRRRAVEQGRRTRVVTGPLEIDLLHRRVLLHGQPVHLARKSYEVLEILAENPGRVISHRRILSSVWGAGHADRVTYLRFVIRDLRVKLEPEPSHPKFILTEAHVGYRLDLQPCGSSPEQATDGQAQHVD
jgi:two-component system, OmpR family, KDP operon response regulator KdpE